MMGKKVPAALFVVAALIAGTAVLDDSRPPAPSAAEAGNVAPDPLAMRANGYGYEPTEVVVDRLRAQVRSNPEDYVNRTRLGGALLRQARETGDLTLVEQSERHLRRAVADGPGDAAAESGLAGALAAQHDFAGALDLLRDVQRRQPNDPGTLAAIADAEIELGDYQAGFATVDDLAGALPDNPATLARQANVAALTGRNADAVELSGEALARSANLGLRPSDAAASWFLYGAAQYQAGQVEDAEASLRSALVIDAENLGASELLAMVVVAQGRLDEAADLYEALLARAPAADLHGLLAEVYAAQGRDDDAAEQARLGAALAEEQVGRFPAERRHLAAFFADQDPARFLELMREDLATRQDVRGLDLLAWALYLNGDITEAQQVMDEVLRVGIVDAPVLFHAGMIAIAGGQEDAGRDLLEQALDLNPGFDLGDVATARATLAATD